MSEGAALALLSPQCTGAEPVLTGGLKAEASAKCLFITVNTISVNFLALLLMPAFMKFITLIFSISIVLVSHGQKIALLSADFKKPIIYTDSVTVEQISQGYFAVSSENFDTLYANLKYLKEMLETRQRAKMQSFELRAGSTIITVERVPAAYGDQYSISAKTKSGEINSILGLTNLKKNNNKNADNINNLMIYIRSNKSLFKSPAEIQPKIYNIVVIAD